MSKQELASIWLQWTWLVLIGAGLVYGINHMSMETNHHSKTEAVYDYVTDLRENGVDCYITE